METMEITLDEIIINLVRENKCLYDKGDVNFKNTRKKKDLWQIISTQLKDLYNVDTSADAVEKRWISLRDMFSRENRKQKSLPSGSGYECTKEWELYRTMLFLAPHIAHRQTKTSLLSCNQPTCFTQAQIETNDFSPSSGQFRMSTSPITVDHDYSSCEKSLKGNNTRSEDEIIIVKAVDEPLNRPSSALSSCSSSSSSVFSATPKTSSNLQNLKSSLFKPIKKAVPELDTFAKRKKHNDQLVDTQIAEASSAISVAVNSVSSLISNQKESKNGYMMAIEEELNHVTEKCKTQDVIEILQIIQKYEER